MYIVHCLEERIVSYTGNHLALKLVDDTLKHYALKLLLKKGPKIK